MQQLGQRWVALAIVATLSSFAAAGTNVPGSANLWFAGVPDGTSENGDIAPDNSPVQLPLTLPSGGYVTFTSVTGSVDYGGSMPMSPPDGDLTSIATYGGSNFGKSGLTAPVNSLIGVFLDARDPSGLTPPSAKSYATASSINFSALSPALRQTFFIGDGKRSNGVLQQFNIPTGATRLFVGSMDGTGWYNNTGSFDVTAQATPVPEPASVTIVGLGIAAFLRRRRK